ncbi:MAG: hypothetical protein GEV08_13300, partial [Acidimicrobiia bacterium]|nr:hypothetical protein [Acidimicrobiia bacterium]
MARLHGASCRARRVAVGMATAVVLLAGPVGARPAHAAAAGTPSPTTAGPSAPAPAPADLERIELQVDYGERPAAPTGPDPAVVALVIAAGAHLIGIGAWATTRVARARREE